MSRPRKSNNLKAISGTIQKCRVIPENANIPALDEIPAAPDWLPNAHSVKEWDRLTRILIENKLLTEASLSALAMLCALHGKMVQLYAAGETPTASMHNALKAMQADFGLPPSAQSKVKPSIDKETSKNPFAKNGKRTA